MKNAQTKCPIAIEIAFYLNDTISNRYRLHIGWHFVWWRRPKFILKFKIRSKEKSLRNVWKDVPVLNLFHSDQTHGQLTN